MEHFGARWFVHTKVVPGIMVYHVSYLKYDGTWSSATRNLGVLGAAISVEKFCFI